MQEFCEHASCKRIKLGAEKCCDQKDQTIFAAKRFEVVGAFGSPRMR
jgi:hypothetical protein